jgi:hypothetical protein
VTCNVVSMNATATVSPAWLVPTWMRCRTEVIAAHKVRGTWTGLTSPLEVEDLHDFPVEAEGDALPGKVIAAQPWDTPSGRQILTVSDTPSVTHF